MRILKGLLTMMLTLFLILDVTLWLTSFTLERTVLQPGFYEQVLEKNAVYSSMIKAITNSLDEQMLPEVPKPYRERVRTSLTMALNETWLKEQFAGTLEGMIGYLKGEKPVFEASVSFVKPKEVFLKGMTEGLSSKEASQAATPLAELDRQVPDRLDLVKDMDQASLTDLRKAVEILGKTQWISLALGFLTMVFLWILKGSNISSLRSAGMPLVFSGIPGLAASLWGPGRIEFLLTRDLPKETPLSALNIDVHAIISSLLHGFASGITMISGVVIIAGLLVITLSFLPVKKKTPS